MPSTEHEKGDLSQIEQLPEVDAPPKFCSLTIETIQAVGLPLGKTVGTYVVIKHGSDKYTTVRLDAGKIAVQWDDHFEIKTSDITELLGFELRRRRTLLKCIPGPSQSLGTSQIQFSKLAQCQGQVEVPMNNTNSKFLIKATSDLDSAQEIKSPSIQVSCLTHAETMEKTEVQTTSNTLQVNQMKGASASDSALHTHVSLDINNQALRDAILKPSRLDKVIEVIDPVAQVLETIAEVHPIAQVAWIAVSSIYQIVKAKHERNEAIITLYDTMIKTYKVATEGEKWKDDKFMPMFKSMVKHSMDCYMFISDYQSDGSFRQMLRFDAAKKIGDFTQTFKDLNEDFTSTQTMHTTQSLLRILPMIEEIDLEPKLRRLQPSGSTLGPKSHCLPGTRRATLETIMKWMVEGNESIFWLFGVAGSGKSALMGTLHNTFTEMGFNSRLAAFIRFDRSDYKDARMFIRTLAYRLAEFDARLGVAIADVVSTNHPILDSTDLSMQLKELILEPLRKCDLDLRNEGPVVIIIDGLDECTHSDRTETDFRGQLLRLLVENPFRSFHYIRLVVASRPEEDIKMMLSGQKHIVAFPLDITTDQNRQDVKYFIKHKLVETEKIKPGFLDSYDREDVVDKLSERASGLFIWASTVVAFVAGHPHRRIPQILETNVPTDALRALTTLYRTALDSVAGEYGDEDIQTDIRRVLGRIMASNSLDVDPSDGPLTTAVLDGPFGHADAGSGTVGHFRPILEKLWSVIQEGEAGEEHQNLNFLHKSFDDFLTDLPRCTEAYYIDMKEHFSDWALVCISYFISFLTDHAEHPRYDGSETIDLPFHEFAMVRWSIFLAKLDLQDVKSRPKLHNALTIMLQIYLLRFMSMGIWHLRAGGGYCCGLVADNLLQSWTMNENIENEPSLKCLVDGSKFLESSTKFIDSGVGKKEHMTFLFQWLCGNCSNLMYRYYMPAFVKMASGSRRYSDILEAIEKDPTPPIIDEDEVDVDLPIEILEVPQEEIQDVIQTHRPLSSISDSSEGGYQASVNLA